MPRYEGAPLELLTQRLFHPWLWIQAKTTPISIEYLVSIWGGHAFKCSTAFLSVKSSLVDRFFPLFTGISHHLRNFPIFYRPFTHYMISMKDRFPLFMPDVDAFLGELGLPNVPIADLEP